MNTSVRPDVEDTEQLDFESQCTTRIPHDGPTCYNNAAWVSVKRCGHVGLMCETCKAKARPTYPWRCFVCGREWASMSEALIELRRL